MSWAESAAPDASDLQDRTLMLFGGNREHGGGGVLLPVFRRVGGAVPVVLLLRGDV